MDQQEHGVNSESQSQEGNNLCAGSIEVDPQERSEAHAGTNVESDQEDATETETSLRSDSVRPSVEAAHSVHNLKYLWGCNKMFSCAKMINCTTHHENVAQENV